MIFSRTMSKAGSARGGKRMRTSPPNPRTPSSAQRSGRGPLAARRSKSWPMVRSSAGVPRRVTKAAISNPTGISMISPTSARRHRAISAWDMRRWLNTTSGTESAVRQKSAKADRGACLIAPESVKPFLAKPLYAMRCCGANWPRRSAERSRVAGAPRGPGSGRSSRPHRGWGSGAQARSQRRSPASRPRRVRVVGSGQACAGFTVVSAVGTGPPHDGPSRDRPSKVSGAVRDGRRPIGGMASPTSPAGTSQVSDDGRNTGTRRSAHGLYS